MTHIWFALWAGAVTTNLGLLYLLRMLLRLWQAERRQKGERAE